MSFGNVLIFGDSYSTYRGCIPEGFAHYYGREDTEICGVKNADMTWWQMLLKETESTLLLNNSWSGSTVCYTGYNGDCSNTNSFIFRLECMINDGFDKKNKVDTVFVFGGTNDNWANAPIGEVTDKEVKREDRFQVLPGFCHFAKLLKDAFPCARIVYIVNTELKPEVSNGINEVCRVYGAECVNLENIDKINGHPTALGMIQIKDQVKTALMRSVI